MVTDMPSNRLPYVATLVAFLAIVIMLTLGFWQLERKAEKDLRLSNIEQASQSESLSIEEAFNDLEVYQDYSVTFVGTAQNKHIYIDNKLHDGRAGFHVLVPYSSDIGTVMVNLGWIPSTGARGDLPSFVLAPMDIVSGVIHLPLQNSFIRETNNTYGEFPVLLQQVDLDEISLHLGEQVLPATIRLLPDDSQFARQWQAVAMSPDKHLGYAVQWFGLAVAALTVYLLSMLKRFHGPSVRGRED